MPTYSYIVLPSNGLKIWPKSNGEPINPAIMIIALGKPKKKKNKQI